MLDPSIRQVQRGEFEIGPVISDAGGEARVSSATTGPLVSSTAW